MTESTSLAARVKKGSPARYGISFLGIGLALALGQTLPPLLGGSLPYMINT